MTKDPQDMKVDELKKELKKRKLAVSGRKQELLDRLLASIEEESRSSEDSPKQEPVTTEDVSHTTQEPSLESKLEAPAEKIPAAQTVANEEQASKENSVQEASAQEPAPQTATIQKPTSQGTALQVNAIPEHSTVNSECVTVTGAHIPTTVEVDKQGKVCGQSKTPELGTAQAVTNDNVPLKAMDISEPSLAERLPKRALNQQEAEEITQETKRVKLDSDEEKTSQCIVRISGFQRGTTKPAAVESKLSEYGVIRRFWIDQFKSACLVQYATNVEATAAKNALDGSTWPTSGDNTRPPLKACLVSCWDESETNATKSTSNSSAVDDGIDHNSNSTTLLRPPTVQSSNGQTLNESPVKSSPSLPLEGVRSRALLIKNFVRPLTIPQVKQLLSEYGQPEKFWMNNIKTYCYVSFATEDEAEATGKAVNGRLWGSMTTSKLHALFVPNEEVDRAIQSDSSSNAPMDVDSTRELDDMFRKTTTKPPIYYLPVNNDVKLAVEK